jgi:hypothetical protein
LAAISLATVPVTPMTFVQFNFKFYKKLRNSQNKNMPICIYSMVYGEAHVVIQERQGDCERFPEGVLPSRSTFVEVHLRLCETF